MAQVSARAVAARATPAELVAALVADHPHPFAGLEGRFPCPRCAYIDHNGATATLDDGDCWHCHRCGTRGTRYRLERLVLEDAGIYVALLELLAVNA